MTQFWRGSLVTTAGLFLESCAFYLIIKLLSTVLNQSAAALPFWLVLLGLIWSYLLSFYVQTLRFSPNLRGFAGVSISLLSVLILSHLHTGMGIIPVGSFLGAGLDTVFRQVLVFAFLVLLWWRGSTIAHDETTLDTMRSSFQWGMVVLFVAVLMDSLSDARIINGYLIVGFFGVGLAGLSLARFASEASDAQEMSLDWWVPIGVSVGAVLLLGLLISAVGLGGLDDVTRLVLKMALTIGFWVIKPLLLALGFVAGILVALGNWLSSMFGGGDLSGLERAQEQIRQFHESMQAEAGDGGPPSLLVALLKWLGFLAATGVAIWILYRVFRFRRLLRVPGEVEETRESLFSWKRANDDLSALLNEWWNNLVSAGNRGDKPDPEPRTPREFYHALLRVASRLGRPREEWQTPREHQGTLQGLLPGEPVRRIVDGFQSAHYGDIEPGQQEIEALHQAWSGMSEVAQEQTQEEETREEE